MVTIKDVAKKAGVSPMTVSYVLNRTKRVSPKTRERVLSAVRELNYRPNAAARGLVKGRSDVVGFYSPLPPDDLPSNPFYARLVNGLAETCAQRGYALQFLSAAEGRSADPSLPGTEPTPAVYYLEQRICGVVMTDPSSDTAEIEQLLEHGCPVVLIGRPARGVDVPFVDVDNVAIGYVLTRHLLEQGCRQIAFLGERHRFTLSAARYQGYIRALQEAGQTVNSKLGADCLYTCQSGFAATARLLEEGVSFDGLLCPNDLAAIGAIRALKSAGREVPAEVAVAGVGDIEAGRFIDPPLTSMSLPSSDEGRLAGSMLLNLVEGKELTSKRAIVDTQLIVRSSSCRSKQRELRTAGPRNKQGGW